MDYKHRTIAEERGGFYNQVYSESSNLDHLLHMYTSH